MKPLMCFWLLASVRVRVSSRLLLLLLLVLFLLLTHTIIVVAYSFNHKPFFLFSVLYTSSRSHPHTHMTSAIHWNNCVYFKVSILFSIIHHYLQTFAETKTKKNYCFFLFLNEFLFFYPLCCCSHLDLITFVYFSLACFSLLHTKFFHIRRLNKVVVSPKTIFSFQ